MLKLTFGLNGYLNKSLMTGVPSQVSLVKGEHKLLKVVLRPHCLPWNMCTQTHLSYILVFIQFDLEQ